jgi:hypothetical protein
MEEYGMDGQKSTSWLLLVALLALVMQACAGPLAVRTPPSTPVSVADFKAVAGVWEGLLRGLPGAPSREDWVMMEIGSDGSYSFATFRPIGVFHGSGMLRLSAGQLILQGADGGTASFTLFEESGRRLLRADAVSSTGQRLRADLTPKR